MATFEYNKVRVEVASGRTIAETLTEVKRLFEAKNIRIPDNCIIRAGGYPLDDDLIVIDNLFVITDS